MADELDDGLQFDVLAAVLRADGKESSQLLEHLATMLEGAVPEHCSVKRSGGLLTKKKVEEVAVRFEKTCFVVKRRGAGLSAHEQQIVRDVVLKTTDVEFDLWIDHLAKELSHLSEKNSKTKEALSSLVLR